MEFVGEISMNKDELLKDMCIRDVPWGRCFSKLYTHETLQRGLLFL